MSASKVRPPRKFNHFELTRPTDLAAAYHYDKVLGVLAKEPNDRSDSDICQIKSWFQKKSDLFNQLNDGMLLVHVCQVTLLYDKGHSVNI